MAFSKKPISQTFSFARDISMWKLNKV